MNARFTIFPPVVHALVSRMDTGGKKFKKKVRRVRATTQNNAILLGNFENNAADLFYGSAARFASHVFLEMLVRRFRVECDKCMSHK